ncbi:MAG: DNA translocase FtsK [Gammaproteobacteria bacterium]
MAQATRRSKVKEEPVQQSLWGNHLQQRLREGQLILLCALALFMVVSLGTYHPADPGWSHAALSDQINNAGGWIGSWLADIFLLLLGYLAYLLPVMLAYSGWTVFREWNNPDFSHRHLLLIRTGGFILVFLSGTALMHLHFPEFGQTFPVGSGGALGVFVSKTLVNFLNFKGATLILLAFGLIGITLSTGLSWLKLMDTTGQFLLWSWRGIVYYWDLLLKNLYDYYQQKSTQRAEMQARKLASEPRFTESEIKEEMTALELKPARRRSPRLPRIIDVTEETNITLVEPKPPVIVQPLPRVIPKPRRIVNNSAPGLPSLDLLDLPPAQHTEQYTPAELEHMSRDVENKLLDFGVTAKVVGVMPGPVITRFELELAPGIKVSKITGLAKDLARSLAIVSVRVVEVIPGKPYIGLELPNRHRESVSLREVLSTEEFEKSSSPVTLALGKDIAGHPMIVDLAKMPHVLVAGTTGAGKSVGVNSMLLSLLFKSSPEDVRLILIDPKMLELSIYEGIPHLMCPVVIDMKEAANALTWSVAEMERRYRLMAAMGVRNMASFNRKVRDAIERGEPIPDPLFKVPGQMPPTLTPFPFIVIVIDEFADMMMVVGKKVEELIARIAQKARAAGIHLILATQRPSVDVITGLIKANIPTRIAFQVASRIDSRTILDQQGAEQLLGRGDMLYLPAGAGVPVRVHGAFVADQEVHSVVNDWKQRAEPQYDESILQTASPDSAGGLFGFGGEEGAGDSDPLYDDAVRIVTESRRASISNIQRRLKIGYNRAARLVEEMEAAGIVSAMQGNGSREVLVAGPPED